MRCVVDASVALKRLAAEESSRSLLNDYAIIMPSLLIG